MSFSDETVKNFGRNAKVNETVGKDWFHSFMAQHPRLSLHTSEAMSYGHGHGLNCLTDVSCWRIIQLCAVGVAGHEIMSSLRFDYTKFPQFSYNIQRKFYTFILVTLVVLLPAWSVYNRPTQDETYVMQCTVMLSEFCLSVCPSVCLSMCQMRVLWQN